MQGGGRQRGKEAERERGKEKRRGKGGREKGKCKEKRGKGGREGRRGEGKRGEGKKNIKLWLSLLPVGKDELCLMNSNFDS